MFSDSQAHVATCKPVAARMFIQLTCERPPFWWATSVVVIVYMYQKSVEMHMKTIGDELFGHFEGVRQRKELWEAAVPVCQE